MASKGEDRIQIKEDEPIRIVNCDEGDEEEEEDYKECLEEQPENAVPILAPVSGRLKTKVVAHWKMQWFTSTRLFCPEIELSGLECKCRTAVLISADEMSSPNATLKLLTVDTRKVFSKLLCRTPGGLEEPYVCVVWLEGNDYLTPMREKVGDRGNFGCHTLKESRGILSTLMKNWTAFSWYRWNIRVYDPNEFVRLKFPKCENFQKREIKAPFFLVFSRDAVILPAEGPFLRILHQ